MIEIHMLRYVLAAADTGSFSRAADQFGIKQSTLSKRVQHLEDRLGLALFRRTSRGVEPTDRGMAIVSRARDIVGDVEALDRDAKRLATGQAGTIRLGFQGSLACGDLAGVLRDFRQACPGIEVEAIERDRDRLLDALDRQRLDLVICGGHPLRPGLRSLSCWREPVLAGLPEGHPLARCERLYWTDLRDLTFVIARSDTGADVRDMINARLGGPGHRPFIVEQDVSRENLMAFAAMNRVTISTGLARLNPVSREAPVLLALHDAFGPTELDQSVHWRRDNDSAAIALLLEMIARRCGRSWPLE